MMFLPREDGTMGCPCGFETDDVFDYLDHEGTEYSWAIRLAKNYTFDMFGFLETLNSYNNINDKEKIFEHIQSTALLFINSAEKSLEEYVEESVVQDYMPDLLLEVDKILKEKDE